MTRLWRFVIEHHVLVPLWTLIAVVWANTASPSYFQFSEAFSFPVNDIGMAFALASGG